MDARENSELVGELLYVERGLGKGDCAREELRTRGMENLLRKLLPLDVDSLGGIAKDVDDMDAWARVLQNLVNKKTKLSQIGTHCSGPCELDTLEAVVSKEPLVLCAERLDSWLGRLGFPNPLMPLPLPRLPLNTRLFPLESDSSASSNMSSPISQGARP